MISTRCNGTTRRQSLWASRKETRTADPLTPNSSLVSQKILHAEGKPCSQLYNWDILWTSSSRLCAALARGYAILCAAHRVSMPLCAAFIKVCLLPGAICAAHRVSMPLCAAHHMSMPYALPSLRYALMRGSLRESPLCAAHGGNANMRCLHQGMPLYAAFLKVRTYNWLFTA